METLAWVCVGICVLAIYTILRADDERVYGFFAIVGWSILLALALTWLLVQLLAPVQSRIYML